jgi:hypothetical protein
MAPASASNLNGGYLTNADFIDFSSKQPAGNYAQFILLSGDVTGVYDFPSSTINTTLSNYSVGINNLSASISGTQSASTFLRGDNTWAVPTSNGVTNVSVATANGFNGSVATSTSTPVITIGTNISGILKGNGSALTPASALTDYQIPISFTTTGTSGAATFNPLTGALNIPQYVGGVTSVSGGSSGLTPASATTGAITLAGTLNVSNGGSGATSLTGILKGNGTSAFTSATPGIDYSAGTSALTTGILKSTNATGTLSIATAADFPTLNQNTTGSAASFTGLLSGDVTGTQNATIVGKINGTSLAGLTTGLLKNTTGSGVPSIAVAGNDYQIPIIFSTSGTSGAATYNPSTGALNIPQYAGGGGTTNNAVTFINSGGSVSGTSFNGSTAPIISYNTIGAPSTTGLGATGTSWGIGITGNAANVTGIVAIANGGTNASTAAQALVNLGAAPIASPTFTGVPAAPTAIPGTNTSQLATTAFVTAAVTAATSGVTTFSGGSTGLTPNTATAGPITLSGTLGVPNGGTGLTTWGASGTYLSSNGALLSWATPSILSGGTMNGTTNFVAKFNSNTSVTNSLIQDNGSNVTIGTSIPATTTTIPELTTSTATSVVGTNIVTNSSTGVLGSVSGSAGVVLVNNGIQWVATPLLSVSSTTLTNSATVNNLSLVTLTSMTTVFNCNTINPGNITLPSPGGINTGKTIVIKPTFSLGGSSSTINFIGLVDGNNYTSTTLYTVNNGGNLWNAMLMSNGSHWYVIATR